MWLPLVGIPRYIKEGLAPYRDLFCREAGFEHVSRYVSGLLLSTNKTLQGIDAHLVWPEAQGASRRAMHAGVFKANWDSEELMPQHHAVISGAHRGRGLEVISLDWTYAPHERGPKIYAAKRMYDYVEGRTSRYQTLVTAAVANAERVDGVAIEVQFPNYQADRVSVLEQDSPSGLFGCGVGAPAIYRAFSSS